MILMMPAFYKRQPIQDTPYRQLVLERKDGKWTVRLMGGTKWGRESRKKLKVIRANSFGAAREQFDRLFGELEDEGWKVYSPFEPW